MVLLYVLVGTLVMLVDSSIFGNLFGGDSVDSSGLFYERRRGTPIDPPALHTTVDSTRGVHPSEFELYTQSTFKCKSGSKEIDSKHINDGFADCEDASDEPGTSAAGSIFKERQFICLNEEHRPLSISSSRVDDGICDCCDGSDEGILTACGNYCRADKEAEMLAKADLIEKFQIGSKSRRRLVNEATKIYNEKRTKQRELEEALSILNQEKDNLQEAFDTAKREREDLVTNLKEAATDKISKMLGLKVDVRVSGGHEFTDEQLEILMSALFDSLESHVAKKRETIVGFLREKNLHPSSEDEEVDYDNDRYGDTRYDDDYEDKDSWEEEFEVDAAEVAQEVSVSGEAEGEEERAHVENVQEADDSIEEGSSESIGSEDEVDSSEEVPREHMRDFVLYVVDHLDCHDQLSLLVGFYSLPENQGIQNSEKAVEFVKQTIGNSEKCTSHFSQIPMGPRFCGELSSALKGELASFKDVPEVSGREEISEIEDRIRTKQSEVNEGKKFQERFLKLQGGHSDGGAVGLLSLADESGIVDNCLRTKDHQYEYSICFGEPCEARQGDTRLGELDRMEIETNTGIIKLHFTEGDHCWNHGPRVAEVSMSCGSSNAILSISEPSTCVYLLDATSPVACTPAWKDANHL